MCGPLRLASKRLRPKRGRNAGPTSKRAEARRRPKRKGFPMSDATSSNRFQTRVTATLSVRNWARAIDFYKAAFDAIELYRVEGGGVGQLSVAGAEFWVAEESPTHLNFSPESLGGCSVRMLLIVEDPAEVCRRAVAAGASQVSPVNDAHGWRIGRIVDPAGHHWEIARKLH